MKGGVIVSGVPVADGAKTMAPLKMYLHSLGEVIVSGGCFSAVQNYDPPSS